VEQQPQTQQHSPRNVQLQHQETIGMGMATQPQERQQPNRPQQASSAPIHVKGKIGRNEKVKMISPSGEEIIIKHKKLQDYINKGYKKVA
jgi:preprotein translocase subunit SecA